MQTSFRQKITTLLMVALIGASVGGTSVSAQTPTPEPPQPTVRQIGIGEDPSLVPTVEPGDSETQEETISPTTELELTDISATPETLLDNTANTTAPIAFQANAASPSVIDISTPNGIIAGDVITYTYTFTNTISDSDFYVQAWWLDYSPKPNGNPQYCDDKQTPKNCDPIPETAYQLPSRTPLTVTHQATCPAGVTPVSSTCYLVSGLPRSQKGQFQIRMRTRSTLYPKTGVKLTSLSGSAKLLPPNSSTGVGEDTAATMIVGPVLSAVKTAVTTGSIYTGDEGTFKIVVGNAVKSGDISKDGTIRADARAATNILVIDAVPIGSTFVSSNQFAYQQPYDPAKDKEVRWLFPGPLEPGKSLPDIQVVFKKVGGSTAECDKINNANIKLTSSGYPLTNGVTPLISFTGASIPVITPLKIKSIQSDKIVFGETGDIQITVLNNKTTAVNDVTLTYQLPTGVSFIGATPKETSKEQADPNTPPKITWTFNIPAGTASAPKEMTFTITVQGGFQVSNAKGTAVLTAASLPIDCNIASATTTVSERVTIHKESPETFPKTGAIYLPEGPTDFRYIIELENLSNSQVTGLEIIDKIPYGSGANFSYIEGSAVDNDGNEVAPVEVTDQQIRWENISIEPQSILRINYTLRANGYNYVDYCNNVTATIYHENASQETVKASRGTSVCVRFNPPLDFEKTVDKSMIIMEDDGSTPEDVRTVRYTLKVKNNGSISYPVGFVDDMDKRLTYVPGSTIANPTIFGGEPIIATGRMTWESLFPGGVVPTIPPGSTYTLSFSAIVPEGCNNTANITYNNTQKFRDDRLASISINPAPVAKVTANCGKIETSVKANPSIISLANTQDFVVTIKNTSVANTESNLPVEVRLPSGYTYVGINTGSAILTAPTTTISGTFTTLKWTLPFLGKAGTSDATKEIKFKGRAGLTILPATVADGVWARTTRNGTCRSGCVPDPEGGPIWSAAAVKVDALITLASKFAEAGCAEVNTTRTYDLTVANNSDLDYTSTTITVTLPLGLEYVNKIGNTVTPIVTTIDGKQTLIWANQTIGKKVGATTTKLYSLSLKVTGKGGGALAVASTASSAVGAFPPRTGVVDPTVFICLSKPAIWFNSAPVAALPGQTAVFEIQATNPLSDAYALGFEYAIPDTLTYITDTADIEDPTYVTPDINGNVLSWPSVTLPAAADTSTYGQLVIRFKMRINDDAVIGSAITSKISVTKNIPHTSSMPLVEIKDDTTTLLVMRSIYLPMALR